MKKYFLAILIALMVVLIPSAKAVELPKKTNHEKVNVYLFYASWCPHCHDFIKYFSEKYVDYEDYFQIVTYEVSSSKANEAVMSAVGEKFGETDGSIPLIVIGDKFHQSGFGTDGTNIIEEALKEYQNKKYVDLVAKTIKEKKLTNEGKTFLDACKITNISCTGYEAVEDTTENETDSGLPAITNHEKVKVYLFYASWCPHCHDFLEYFGSRYEKYADYFEIVTIQGDDSSYPNNSALISDMVQYYGLDGVGYPLIVIGSEFHQSGFGSDGTNIIEEALKQYQDDNYQDIVAAKIKEKGYSSSIMQRPILEACSISNVNCSASTHSGGELIAVIIIAVVVIGFGTLLYMGRKNR